MKLLDHHHRTVKRCLDSLDVQAAGALEVRRLFGVVEALEGHRVPGNEHLGNRRREPDAAGLG